MLQTWARTQRTFWVPGSRFGFQVYYFVPGFQVSYSGFRVSGLMFRNFADLGAHGAHDGEQLRVVEVVVHLERESESVWVRESVCVRE